MIKLIATYKGKDYAEGDEVYISGKYVKIEHITTTGFLYKHSWGFLKFVRTDINTE